MIKQLCLAGGCFWGVQKYLSLISGVLTTEVGYANGHVPNPSYEEVCSGQTGAAEAVLVSYDSSVISLTFLLNCFFDVIDPTTVNRQGNDVGTQYRSGVYYSNPDDAEIIAGAIILLGESYDLPLAIEAAPLGSFFPAEEYHQDYLDKNPGGYCHIKPEHFAKARNAVELRLEQAGTGLYESSRQQTGFSGSTDEDKRQRLTPLQYEVTQHGATEPPFQNEYYACFEEGIYVDVCDGTPLFVSTDKFESGCGWPSFSKPISPDLLRELDDYSYGRERVEIRAQASNAHLGHVFDDGPVALGGLRYCINSASLRFIPKAQMSTEGYADYLSLL